MQRNMETKASSLNISFKVSLQFVKIKTKQKNLSFSLHSTHKKLKLISNLQKTKC